MANFFPTRAMSVQEWAATPRVVYQLLRAYFLVRWVPARYWLPVAIQAAKPQVLAQNQIQQAHQLALLIQGVARRLPWQSTCLMSALAAWHLLQKRGVYTRIQIGVQAHAKTGLGAHAWLLMGEEVLLGGKEAHNFQEINVPLD